MAMFNLGLGTKTPAPRRETEGRKNLHFPVMEGIAELGDRLPSCSGCPLAEQHDPCTAIHFQVPFGEHRYQRVPDANRILKEDVDKFQAALFLIHYVLNGYISDSNRYNVGWGGSNPSQTVGYEIMSVTDDIIELKGRNPKKLSISTFVPNPDWPLEGSRLEEITTGIVLPIGASVEFISPSILAGRLKPLILEIQAPVSDDDEDVTFFARLNCKVNNAKQPYDAALPPSQGRYYCQVRFEASFPANWHNIQEQKEVHWSRRIINIEGPQAVILKNSAEEDTRIIPPMMMPGSAIVISLTGGADAGHVFTDEEIHELIDYAQEPTTFVTTLDLTGFDFETAEIIYHPEATENDNYHFPGPGSCANSQVYYKYNVGSYANDAPTSAEGRCCTAAAVASQLGTYRLRCWQPRCSHFGVGINGSSVGTLVTAPTDFGDASLFASFWSRYSWVLSQGIPGVSSGNNFTLERPAGAGPSLQGLTGGWTDRLYDGYYAYKEPYDTGMLGTLFEWTDDGNDYQEIVYGAYFRASYDFTGSGGPVHNHSPSTATEHGFYPDNIDGWDAKTNMLGDPAGEWEWPYPWRGTGAANVGTYALAGHGLDKVGERITNAEFHLTNCNLSTPDEDLVTFFETRFPPA